MNDRCPKCGCHSIAMLTVFRYDGRNMYRCEYCGHDWLFPPLEVTVFQQITQSEEALADKLVYEIRRIDPVFGDTYYWWCSAIISAKTWAKREEALAETVKKLKEVVE